MAWSAEVFRSMDWMDAIGGLPGRMMDWVRTRLHNRPWESRPLSIHTPAA